MDVLPMMGKRKKIHGPDKGLLKHEKNGIMILQKVSDKR